MKKTILLYLLTCTVSMTQAQQPSLNHIAQYVHDLSASARFYQEIIGLDSVPEPFHDGRHAWFRIGPKTTLHLISGAGAPEPREKNTHLCFTVTNLDLFIARLIKAKIPFEDWPGKPNAFNTRVDGVRQIYFRDPDGYWIEVNDEAAKASR